MKAFIGRYYKTAQKAVEAFNKMAEWNRKNHTVAKIGGAFFIIGLEQVKALKEK